MHARTPTSPKSILPELVYTIEVTNDTSILAVTAVVGSYRRMGAVKDIFFRSCAADIIQEDVSASGTKE